MFVMNNGMPFTTNALIYGLSFGVGSGWNGSFDGAVDNVSVTVGSGAAARTTTFNFETVTPAATVPEPASIALVGAGLLAAGVLRRRRA